MARRKPRAKRRSAPARKGPPTAAEIARRYAEDVVNGKIVAGRLTQLACARHLNDLKHGQERGLRFSAVRAQHIVDFIQRACRHVEGEHAGKLIALEPWQVFGLACRYGWERYSDRHGRWLRRFRRSYEEVARKQAKSTIKAAEALYMLAVDGEQGAQVYSFATTYGDAEIIFRLAKGMVHGDPRLESKIETYAHRLVHPASGSFFAPLHAKPRSKSGLNVHFAVADEYWAHRDRGMWDIIATAQGARAEPMISAITTAGSNLAGPCYEAQDYVRKVLDGAIADDEQYGMIYTLDEEDQRGDNWQDPAVWPKANPALGGFLDPKGMLSLLTEARQLASAAISFKTLHLNIWVGALRAYYDIARWQACADPTLRMEDFRGLPCWMAVDLAQVYDCNAVLLLFERDGCYYVFPRFYLPEATVRPREDGAIKGHGVYRQLWHWSQQSAPDGRPWITLTPGEVVDFDLIEREIAELAERYAPQEVLYDSYQTGQLVQHLMERGIPMVKFAATAQFLSQPMKDAAIYMANGRIRHDGNPVMHWMMSNIVGRPVGLDKVYPSKEFAANKIDGPVTMLMALSRANSPDSGMMVIGADYQPISVGAPTP